MLKNCFKLQENNSFNCEECAYKKYVWCCPEEGSCQVQRDYISWIEDKLIGLCKSKNIEFNELYGIK